VIRAVVATALLLLVPGGALAQTFIPLGATWKYLDDGSDAGTAWQARTFADAGWASGPAQLGYGDGDEATVVSFGGNASDKHITTYFRHHFNVADPNAVAGLELRILRDDGAIAFVNGVEVLRSNMPVGAVGFDTVATSPISGPAETELRSYFLDIAVLLPGDNVLAIEVHQSGPTSSDISLDVELAVPPAPGPASLERGPYLQLGTDDGVHVRWRTDEAVDSIVDWGADPNSLTSQVVIWGQRFEHEITTSGLVADARYYYSVGSSQGILAGGDADHFFDTSPVAGTAKPVRIWVIGDSGECGVSAQGCTDATAVMNRYLEFAGAETADVWLMLGDNAYSIGTDAQFTAGVFDVYPDVLRNTVLWPAPGNHEFGASDSPTQSGPYYDTFTMPTNGEAGGEPSGTEAYYSFDYANVHFVSLDSHDTSRAIGGAMYNWLEDDLMGTAQDFIVVYWHHPPYTKGSHDSDDPNDSDGRMKEMREWFLPLIEAYGVDLQLTGHSHSYERSILIDGHYDVSSTFDPNHVVDGGDGDPNGDGGYAKPTLGPASHEGTIYSVVGSSSKNSGGLSLHPVMQVAVNYEGSLVVDVHYNRMDGTFIDKDGIIQDRFRVERGDSNDDDADGVPNASDNCRYVANGDQAASAQEGFEDVGCECLCGDVNRNCGIDSSDALEIVLDAGFAPPQVTFDEDHCDVNGDSACNSSDALEILLFSGFAPPQLDFSATNCAFNQGLP